MSGNEKGNRGRSQRPRSSSRRGSSEGSGRSRRPRSGGGRRGDGDNRQSGSRRSAPHKPEGDRQPSLPPAPAAAQPPSKPKRVLSPETQNLTLSAWDMARSRKEVPDTARGQVMTLRTHQRLVASFEKERNIPELDRSFLRVQEGAEKSALLIHGVSTSPGSMKDLAIQLYDAGLNVYVLRLPDFGTPEDTISEVSWESSLQQARQCYQLLARGGGPVHVVGMGFGATLALHLALAESVASLVLLSPAIMPRESFWQRLLVRLKLHRLGFVHSRLGWTADLQEGMDKARGRIGKIKVPIYGAQCEDDDRAHPDSLRFLQRKARNKNSRFRVYPEGGHAILAHHGKAGLYDDIIQFCGGRL